MKSTKLWAIASLLLILFAFSPIAANAQKVAYVDTEEVIQKMPEYFLAKSELESYGKQLERQLQAKEQKMMDYYEDVMRQINEGTMTPVKQQEAEAELARMQQDLQQAALQADQSLIAKEGELTKPLYEKFDAALKSVASKNGYEFILDKQLLLYSDGQGSIDATSAIKSELGI